MQYDRTSQGFSVLDIAQIGIMVAIIEVSKFVLSGLPNIELTSFWIIMFTLVFGRKIIAVIPVFILIEGAFYGIHLWWIMYLYAWPLLAGIAWIFRKSTYAIFWAVLSAIFGLCFGALCSIPCFVIGVGTGGLASGIRTAITWWIAGIPWDFIHCGGNFIIMLVLYHPVGKVMKRVTGS